MYTIEPIPGAAYWDSWRGYIVFPLTPAVSPGERENGPPSLGHTRDGVCQASMCRARAWRWMFPLPEGEGQGEGKRQFDSHRMSHIQRTRLEQPGISS